MSVALANSDEVTLRKFIVYSTFLHGALALAIGLAAYFQYRSDQWNSVGGNQGNDVKVNLVATAGIPMPKPDSFTDSHAVDPTKGMYKEEPKAPDVAEMPKDALDIPKFKEQQVIKPPVTPTKEFKDAPRPTKVPRPSKVFEDLRPAPNNAVKAGMGGNPNIPTGNGPNPGQTTSGVQVQGQGGGDFTTRYGWYVESVRRKIYTNFDVFTIDPAVRNARRAHAIMTFTISRDGSVKNIRLAQSSNDLSMDNASQRALLASNPLPPLPIDYSGPPVNVTFDFDLSTTK